MKPDRGSRGQTGMLNQQVQLRWNDLLHSRRCRCSSRAVIWPARNCQIRSRLYLVSLVFGKVPHWSSHLLVCFQHNQYRMLPTDRESAASGGLVADLANARAFTTQQWSKRPFGLALVALCCNRRLAGRLELRLRSFTDRYKADSRPVRSRCGPWLELSRMSSSNHYTK